MSEHSQANSREVQLNDEPVECIIDPDYRDLCISRLTTALSQLTIRDPHNWPPKLATQIFRLTDLAEISSAMLAHLNLPNETLRGLAPAHPVRRLSWLVQFLENLLFSHIVKERLESIFFNFASGYKPFAAIIVAAQRLQNTNLPLAFTEAASVVLGVPIDSDQDLMSALTQDAPLQKLREIVADPQIRDTVNFSVNTVLQRALASAAPIATQKVDTLLGELFLEVLPQVGQAMGAADNSTLTKNFSMGIRNYLRDSRLKGISESLRFKPGPPRNDDAIYQEVCELIRAQDGSKVPNKQLFAAQLSFASNPDGDHARTLGEVLERQRIKEGRAKERWASFYKRIKSGTDRRG